MIALLIATRDLFYAVGDGLDMAIRQITPTEHRVRIYEYWKEAQDA